jgi:alkylation response protein AidB-like acyl-CoA dehydrogenase
MDLELAEYQEMMIQSFRDLLAKESSLERIRAVDQITGHDPGLWTRFVEMGGHSLSLVGSGGSFIDAVLVGFEVGRRVGAVPYAEAVTCLRALEPFELPAEDWEALLGGALATYCPANVTLADIGADGRVHGKVAWTAAGAIARYALMVVGDQAMVIDLGRPGVARRATPNLGHQPVAGLALEGAVPIVTAPVDPSWRARVDAERWVLFAALMVGAGRTAQELAIEHVKERRQFDRPIGSFQAVQHRLADRATELDAGELLVLRAASWADDGSEFRRYAASAVTIASQAAELAAKESLQFFGGYGFTLEYDIHLFVRYIKSLSVLARSDLPALQDALLPVLAP